MVLATVSIVPTPSRRAEVLEILQCLQGPTRAQPGCTGYDIYQAEGPDPAVVLVERWESEAALESHLRSNACRSILSAVEMSGSPPEIRFDHVVGTEGIELIERARAVPSSVVPDR
jgi:quinol monooxygenase YgiN